MAADDDLLVHTASNPHLSEDEALALLARRDLPPSAIEALRSNPAFRTARKLLPAIAAHPRTPKHVAIPLVRQMFTFELLRVMQTPGAPADVQHLCEESILTRLESTSTGERLTLAKSATGRIAAALLHDAEARICDAALENPRLTEALIVRELMRPQVTRTLIDSLQVHRKWSLRREIRDAILRRLESPDTEQGTEARESGDEPLKPETGNGEPDEDD